MNSFVLQAQDTTAQVKSVERDRLFVGISISADYCYRTLVNNYGGTIGEIIIDLRNDFEEYKIGYTAGATFCYNISENVCLESGVYFSDKGYSSKKKELVFGDMIDPRFGFSYPGTSSATPAPAWSKIFYNHTYVDVPLKLNFYLNRNKIRFSAGLGLTVNFFMKATQTFVLTDVEGNEHRNTNSQNATFNAVNLSPEFSLGAEKKFTPKLKGRIQPVFRYGLLDIIDAPISGHLWNAGLNFSLLYALK